MLCKWVCENCSQMFENETGGCPTCGWGDHYTINLGIIEEEKMTAVENEFSPIDFIAREIRELKKLTERHTHNIEQLRRAVVALNEINKKNDQIRELLDEIDDLRIRLNEIQAKTHRKFSGGETKKDVVINTPLPDAGE